METPKAETTGQSQSSSQFLHFLRLMHLFPDVHPATLHTVLWICKSDFFCAVDKLLYAKRCKEMQTQRNNTVRFQKNIRFQPYCQNYTRINNGAVMGASNNASVSSDLNNTQKIINGSILGSGVGNIIKIQEPVSNGKICENRNVLTRNRNKTKEKTVVATTSSNTNSDLQIVVSPEYKLPIHPLSPITIVKEDQPQSTNESEK